ncbi:hypothetical protein DYH09_12005 [bacterium CPR1]|nr:hypothetical protein [bacterium CPR1]
MVVHPSTIALFLRPTRATVPPEQDPVSQALAETDASAQLARLLELCSEARTRSDISQCLGRHQAELWSLPLSSDLASIDLVERLAPHSPPPESLEWLFTRYGQRLAVDGPSVGVARRSLEQILVKRPDFADEAAARLLDPAPGEGFTPAQLVCLKDLVGRQGWIPSPEQRGLLLERLDSVDLLGREGQGLLAVLVELKQSHPQEIPPTLGRELLGRLLAEPDPPLYTAAGGPNRGFLSQSIYQLAFPDEKLEAELLSQVSQGSQNALLVLAGSLSLTGGAERLGHRLEAEFGQAHEPAWVDEVLLHVLDRWLEQPCATADGSLQPHLAMGQRYYALAHREKPLSPRCKPVAVKVEPEWLAGMADSMDTVQSQARLVVAFQAAKQDPALAGALLVELTPWLDHDRAPAWTEAATAFRGLKDLQVREKLRQAGDLRELLTAFSPGSTWLAASQERYPAEMARLEPLLKGMTDQDQSALVASLAERRELEGDLACLTSLARLPADERLEAANQVLRAPDFFARLEQIAPPAISLQAHQELCRRVESGMEPEVAFQQVAAPLVLDRVAGECRAVGTVDGYLVVGGSRLRNRSSMG